MLSSVGLTAPPDALLEAARRSDGNPERGRTLFEDPARTGCLTCHRVGDRGGTTGPDLSTIGDTFPRMDLAQAILNPSASIAIGYATTVLTTGAGETVTGVLREASPDETVLALADGTQRRIPTREIVSRETLPASLMPEGLGDGLSPEAFADLVGYLTTLREPVAARDSHRGMPAEIPQLLHPVRLTPLFGDDLRFPHAFVQKPGDIRHGLVWFGPVPGSSGAFLAVNQAGRIWHLEKRADGDLKSVFADLHSEIFNERGPNGILGLAFHPDFTRNRRYFLKHQVLESGRILTRVVERQADADLRRDSGMPSRMVWQVAASTQDHTGGCIGFGPDGFLYIGMGDTGPQRDPQGHGQDPTTHLGKILRIDVDRTTADLGYAVPADNPFVGRPGYRPEIWALGFREPWRFSFDPVTGDLWVGDVGQDRVEEVAIVRRGENHGWNVYEGFEPFSNAHRRVGETYVPPVFAYRRRHGNSITGGHVYRARPGSSFDGVYICGDYTSRRIFGIRQQDRVATAVRQIATSPQNIASFTVDAAGEICLVGYEGIVYRLDLADADFDTIAPPTSSP